jgi:sugar fermentation stimulation protein A
VTGVYILKIFLHGDTRIEVGSLGAVDFKKGYYAYTGSAMGGIEQRVARHLRKSKKLHWHIDYLLVKAEVKNVFVRETDRKSDECRAAAELEKSGGVHVAGFGSSDCRCKSHLFHFRDFPKLPDQNHELKNK